MEADTLRNVNIGALCAVALLVGLDICAHDRLEKQVLRNRELIEQGGGGSVALSATVAPKPGTPEGEGGTGTGQIAVGWGGNAAEILFVSDRKAGAPTVLAGKPRPQSDAYVDRQSGAPGSLNYYTTNDGLTRRKAKYSLEGMLMINPRKPTELWPWLATSWEVSDDKLSYTYRLRRGVRFADGRPFTSADVKFTFDTMRDPAVNAEHLRANFEDVTDVETPDDHTVVVRYRKKDWRGLAVVGFHLFILNKGWYEEQIPSYARRLGIDEFSAEPGTPGFGEVFNKIRVPCPGTGPYYVADATYDPNKPLEMVQNPFWWGIQVHPEWYNFKALRTIFIDDDVAAFEEFRKGTFDVMVVDASAWDDEYSKDEELLKTTKYYMYDHMGLGFSAITWNTRQPPFDDDRVRRAMAHLIDRKWILDEVNRGRGEVGYCFGKPIYDTCKTPGLEPLAFDLDESRRLLAEAGWADTDGDGILDRDGERFEFEVKVGSPRRFYSQVTGLLTDSAAKVGIRASMRTLEWSTFIQDYYEDRFDAAILYHSFADPWIDPFEGNHSSVAVPRGGNRPGWKSAEADELMERMLEEFDAEKRRDMYWEFNELYQQAQPRTHLVHGLVSVLQNSRFEGVEVLPTGMRIHEYWVEPENVKYP